MRIRAAGDILPVKKKKEHNGTCDCNLIIALLAAHEVIHFLRNRYQIFSCINNNLQFFRDHYSYSIEHLVSKSNSTVNEGTILSMGTN